MASVSGAIPQGVEGITVQVARASSDYMGFRVWEFRVRA